MHLGSPVPGSDLLNVYGGGDLQDYLIRFAVSLNPNGKTGLQWPKYATQSPVLLTFLDGLVPLTLTQDTYRREAMEFLTNVLLENPL